MSKIFKLRLHNVTVPVVIEEIIKPAEQGRSGPYFCRGADGHNYFVKGKNTGRRSQIVEWICAHLAKALGLPVAPFALVEIGPELLAETPKAMQEVGAGLAFGSQEYVGALWFELEHVDKVKDITLRRDILVFDWWIRNTDRLTRNSNLLWDAVKEKLVVIDHNLAFDVDFAAPDFLTHHIFGGQVEAVFQDLIEQTQYQTRLCDALAVVTGVYESVPEEWWWFDDERTVETDFNWKIAQALLQRCDSNDFWR